MSLLPIELDSHPKFNMPVKHIVYLRMKAFMSKEEGDEMVKELDALKSHKLCHGGAAGRNHHARNRGYQFAMSFDFASKEDEDVFEHGDESKAFIAKWGRFVEDTIVVDFEY